MSKTGVSKSEGAEEIALTLRQLLRAAYPGSDSVEAPADPVAALMAHPVMRLRRVLPELTERDYVERLLSIVNLNEVSRRDFLELHTGVDLRDLRDVLSELIADGVPSPGSTWRRKVHRTSGWMGSGVRVILQNPLYTGQQRWNTTKFVRNPNTEKIVRRKRPKSEWIVNQREDLRIVSDELFAKAQRRTKDRSDTSKKLKSGGRPKYMLSGLLKCASCGAHYIVGDARSYACSSYLNGCCTNNLRVRRDLLEQALIGPIRDELLSPDRVRRMASELQKRYLERTAELTRRAADVPAELAALDARLERMRERLRKGDPDLADDELQIAIHRAQSKRDELELAQANGDMANVLSILPKAAEKYRQMVCGGLDGNPEAMAQARLVLRDLLGDVQLRPESDGSLWAEYEMRPAMLVRAASTSGRGDRI